MQGPLVKSCFHHSHVPLGIPARSSQPTKIRKQIPVQESLFYFSQISCLLETFLSLYQAIFCGQGMHLSLFCWTNQDTCIPFVLCWMNSNSSANTFSTSIVCWQTLETLLYYTQGSSSRGERALNGGFFPNTQNEVVNHSHWERILSNCSLTFLIPFFWLAFIMLRLYKLCRIL